MLMLSVQVPGPWTRYTLTAVQEKVLPQQDGVKHPGAGVQAAYGAIIAAGEQPCV